MSLTKIFLTCNSFAYSQNNKADTKHSQYLSMILVFLYEMPIIRRASGACKSEKKKCYDKTCTSFESLILKLILDFLTHFWGKPRRSQRGSPKGEGKGGATKGSSQFCFIFNKEIPPSFKYEIKSFLEKKGFFIHIMEESFMFAKKLFFLTIGCC